jgi:hypothetical protein
MAQMQIPSAPAARFAASYTPCHPLSVYHDLRCGHRIEVSFDTESCGSNCVRRNRAAPFICPHCLVADVRDFITSSGMDLDTQDDMDLDEAVESILDEMDEDSDEPTDNIAGSSNSLIQDIADRELERLLKEGKRICKIAPRFQDPTMQFWHQFLVQEGLEGLEAEVDVVLAPVEKKQPNASASKDIWKPRGERVQRDEDEEGLEVPSRLAEIVGDEENEVQEAEAASGADDGLGDLVGLLGQVRVGLELEDEATKAVREAFELCGLTGGFL